jgi:flagellar biosynthesis/type III secretory pathway M-ring protein FliF/YscJ
MGSRSHLPPPPEEQFLRQENHLRFYVAIMLVIAAIVAFVILVAIMVQQKNQISKEISKEHSDTAPATWNGGDASITNVLAPATEPVLPNTNSN